MAPLANVPPHWKIVQTRRVATVRNGADYRPVEVPDGGYPVYGSGGEFRRSAKYLFDGESVLFGRKGTVDRPLLVSGRFWTVDTMFYTELQSTAEARFFYYVALTVPFAYYATNTAVPSMTQNDLSSHPIPLPPLDEQRAIANYLDRETAQIDTLIAEQQRLIELLHERKRGVLTSIFAARVGSGVRTKWLITERDERAEERSAELPLLSVSISWGVRRRDEAVGEEGRADDYSNYKICHPGDLVINRMRAFQGALGIAAEAGIVSPDYTVARPDSDIDPRWIATLMKSEAFVQEMAQRVRGIGSLELGTARTPRINISDLGEILITPGDAEEQAAELAQADRDLSRADTLIAEAERFIELSKERRSALITAAVTGQIEVPGVA